MEEGVQVTATEGTPQGAVKRRPVEPLEGSRMHLMPPAPDRANRRSETPMGFALATFEANVSELFA